VNLCYCFCKPFKPCVEEVVDCRVNLRPERNYLIATIWTTSLAPDGGNSKSTGRHCSEEFSPCGTCVASKYHSPILGYAASLGSQVHSRTVSSTVSSPTSTANNLGVFQQVPPLLDSAVIPPTTVPALRHMIYITKSQRA
jgi:hypothetical protein